jgi:hypothetical protein
MARTLLLLNLLTGVAFVVGSNSTESLVAAVVAVRGKFMDQDRKGLHRPVRNVFIADASGGGMFTS